MNLNVLEFYSGIGGMHLALACTELSYEIIGAIEINNLANQVYQQNFPNVPIMQRNIESLSSDELDQLNADVWTMSPPCQPYTRQGNQNHSKDPRSNSFIEVLKSLKNMLNPPKFIFVENVKGFEDSDTRNVLVETLLERNFVYQEVLISPKHIGIPNSRLRYYLMARLKPFSFVTTNKVYIVDEDNETRQTNLNKIFSRATKLKSIYDMLSHITHEDTEQYKLDDKKLSRFYAIFDIVNPDSQNSCCFTKSYSQLVKGAGSIFSPLPQTFIDKTYIQIMSRDISAIERLDLLKSLQLRHFSPAEASCLMGFPQSFSFPNDVTTKQKYQLIGNSVNVQVVAMLMKNILFQD